jgi:hypothetical protein
MTANEIDLRGPVNLWDKPTDQRHRFQLRQFTGHILEVEDLHFHHDSAVFLPHYAWGEQDAKIPEPDRITGLAVLRACLIHARDNPSHSILIAGHTDTTGKPSYNNKLSKMRADSVLYALQGDRNEWVKIVKKKHRVKDYQQILKWIALTFGFACDPEDHGGVIKKAVRWFQSVWNEAEYGEPISIDGIVGKETWGAFFDLFMYQLKLILENEDENLVELRKKLKFLNDGRKAVGCGERFPIDNRRRDNYESRINRRVEILFYDPSEKPQLCSADLCSKCALQRCELYELGIYRFKHLLVKPILQLFWIDLQTVNAFGLMVPNVELLLQPKGTSSKKIKTDPEGYWQGWVKAGGGIRVTLPDGTPVAFGPSQAFGPGMAPGSTAVIDPRVANRTVTDIFVPSSVSGAGITDKDIEKRAKRVRRYGSDPETKDKRGRTARSGRKHDQTGEKSEPLTPRGGRDPKDQKQPANPDDWCITARKRHTMATDNLWMVAGDIQQNGESRHIDQKRLISVLHKWLHDRHPTTLSRGYVVHVIESRVISIYTSDQVSASADEFNQSPIAQFHLAKRVGLEGRLGVYTLFQVEAERGTTIYVDMMTATVYVQRVPKEKERVVQFIEILANDKEKGDYEALIAGMGKKINLLYWLWEPWFWHRAMRFGGSGLLEDYPDPKARPLINKHIHERNVAVVRNCTKAYEEYIKYYIALVKNDKDIIKKDKRGVKTEPDLFNLGPPDDFFTFPTPINASEEQKEQLWKAGKPSVYSGLRAYMAISDRLHELWGRRPPGTLWVKFEFKLATGEALPVQGEVGLNWTLDTNGKFDSGSERQKTLQVGGEDQILLEGKVPLSVSMSESVDEKGNKTKKMKVGWGKAGIESAENGDVKFSYGLASAVVNQRESVFGFGVEVGFRDFFVKRVLKLKPGDELPPEIKMLPDAKIAIGLFFQGLSVGTTIIVTSRAPGYFQLRPLDQFMRIDWASMKYDEHVNLTKLGWGDKYDDQYKWDIRRDLPLEQIPWSAKNEYIKLKAKHQVAIAQLPLRKYSDQYWLPFWKTQLPQLAQLNPQGGQ